MTQEDVIAVITAFPTGSSGGPNGIRPQHIMDMVSNKKNGHALIASITSFVNMLLEGYYHHDVISIFFGGRLIAIGEKIWRYPPICYRLHTSSQCC